MRRFNVLNEDKFNNIDDDNVNDNNNIVCLNLMFIVG